MAEKTEIEGLIIAAQNHSLLTRIYRANIIKTDQNQYEDGTKKKMNQFTTKDRLLNPNTKKGMIK